MWCSSRMDNGSILQTDIACSWNFYSTLAMYVTKHECADDSFPKHVRQVCLPSLTAPRFWVVTALSAFNVRSTIQLYVQSKTSMFYNQFYNAAFLVLYQIPLPVFTLHHSLNKLILHPGQHSSFFSEEKRRAALDGIWTYNTLLSRRMLYQLS